MAIIGDISTQREGRRPLVDLAHYLAGEFAAGVPLRLNVHATSATGHELADRLVSRLEIAHALTRLPYRQRRIIELLYEDGLAPDLAALRLGISRRTLYRERGAALELMIGAIYEWSLGPAA